MRGAILGDIIGSRFEFSNCKSKRFDLFPQDTFFEADGFIDAIRNAISIGGDSDTIGAITGGIAEAGWGISPRLLDWVRMKLPTDLYEIVGKFVERYVAASSDIILAWTNFIEAATRR